ncbi:MAG: transposase, partial [Corynebacterium sp.]|uniref:transposase n=1 Tax=Corynebacterium sp. TaxID=1720 RepID=UPI0026DEEBDC
DPHAGSLIPATHPRSGRATLWRRREDVLAYFDVGASNGPVEAIDGRLEHLRGIALGFRNLDHYILRSLIHSGQLQARINAL